jgi:hypothetical protein
MSTLLQLDDTPMDEAVRRVRADFLEMPGLQVTVPQAARLWAYEAGFCEGVLGALVETRFLVRERDTFVRADGRT